MSGNYNSILIPEEENTSTGVCETMRMKAKKGPVLFENYFGQRTPVYLYRYYILPSVLLYVVIFSLLAVAPYIILDQIGTPRDTYPTINSVFKNTALFVVCANFICSFSVANCIYSVLGPVYYYSDYYRKNQIGVLETVIVVIYLIAFILQLRICLYFVTSVWTCLSNVSKMHRFANDRLMERSDTLV